MLLKEAGLPANAGRVVESEDAALAAAREIGYPVVLKTAKRGVDHKSEMQGIHLSLADDAAVSTAWRDLAKRIGPRVLVAPMIATQGVEMLLGMVHDDQFGPVVLLGAGGVHVEALADVVYAVPPFDAAEAATPRAAAPRSRLAREPPPPTGRPRSMNSAAWPSASPRSWPRSAMIFRKST